MTLEAEFSLFPEGEDQFGSAADTLEGFGSGMGEVPKLLGTEVGQGVLLEVSPEVFDRVEFGGVGGKELDAQALAPGGDEVCGQSAAVDGCAVPEDQQLAGQAPQEMGQKTRLPAGF